MAIDTPDDLRDHLLLATKVELSTIPIYLSAMYSIKDQQSEAARLIASVVVEEMLHVCLVTNLLLAVGGEPDFGYDCIPRYPSLMAHHKPDLMLELRGCSTEVIRDVFMVIESPKANDAVNEDDEYETLGQFYGALEEAVERLDRESDGSLFADHQATRQLSDASFYAPVEFDAEDSGGLLLIKDVATADTALETIIDQGEGLTDHRWADPNHEELTHFYKFKQIADGDSPIGEVWPIAANPRTADYPAEIRPVSDLFNALYGLMFVTMDQLFSGRHDQNAGIGRLYTLMSRCLAPTARYLVRSELGDGRTAAPTFEVYEFTSDPWREAAGLATSAAASHPELTPVSEAMNMVRSSVDTADA